MLTTYISGKELIGRIDHDLSLDNTDWIARAPLWIADCLAQLDMLPALQPVYADVAIVDYQCVVPLTLKLLDRVVVNNIPLVPHKAINGKFREDAEVLNHATRYAIRPSTTDTTTIMEFGVETGTARFYYHIPAVEVVDSYGVVMPKVPDDIFVFEAVKWFILVKLLQRGYIHPVFNLKENNPFTNAGLLWEDFKLKARNSVSTMDQSERRVISELSRELIKNYDYFYNEGFIPLV